MRNSIKLTLLILASAIIVIFSGVVHGFSSPSPEPAAPSDEATQTITSEYQKQRTVLEDAAVMASRQVNELHKGVANTPEVTTEYAQLLDMIDQYKNGKPLAGYPDILPSQRKTAVQDMSILTDEAVQVLESRTETWSETVDQINNAAAPVGETPETRITRLQQTIGQPLRYRIGECSTTDLIWGCYTPGEDFYTITPAVLTESDCVLRTTLAHEYRHYEQWMEGLTKSQDEVWLESDARDHEWLGGGC
jgi:hypothetical protein